MESTNNKKPGWFSVKYQTSEQHYAARQAYQDKKAKQKIDAEVKLEYWQSLSPQEQLAILDRKFGKDMGAKKQRAKIAAKMAKE